MKADDLEVIRWVTLASTRPTGCGIADLSTTPKDQCVLREMASKSPTPEAPIWVTWGPPDHRGDGIALAITGNGLHGEANAVFFAGARDVILSLCDETERLQRENDELRRHLKHMGSKFSGAYS